MNLWIFRCFLNCHFVKVHQIFWRKGNAVAKWFITVTLLFDKKCIHFAQAQYVLLLPLLQNNWLYGILEIYPLLFSHCSQPTFSGSVFLMCFTQRIDWNILVMNYNFHIYMAQAKLRTMSQVCKSLFKKFHFLPYHVLPASTGAMHIYLFLLYANNKQMWEQCYISQTLSDEQ